MSVLEMGLIAALFFGFALISRRLEGSPLTPPILFTAAGYFAGQSLLGDLSVSFSESEGVIHTLAELTLVFVLAADASGISMRPLSKYRAVPIRLLGIGLPLTIILGTVAGYLILPHEGWIFAALVAAILAPTDAALGASVLSNKAIPVQVRQSLNVESGLNDGIALPAVLFFACFFNLTHQSGEVNWLVFLALQLTLGPLVGIFAGWLGGHVIGWAAERGWITEDMQGVGAMALAVIAFTGAEAVGGNGFIAAFLCGLTYGNLKVEYSHFLHEFTETESQVLSYLTFFLFGLAILPHAFEHVTPEIILYAALSLTFVRILPVIASQLGAGFHWQSLLFLGWFGPRGLASLLFALLVLEDLSVDVATEIQTIVSVTVLMSIVLHGITAGVLGRAYAGWAKSGTTPTCAENAMPEEHAMASEPRL